MQKLRASSVALEEKTQEQQRNNKQQVRGRGAKPTVVREFRVP